MAFYVIASEKVTQVVQVANGHASYHPPYYEQWAVDDFKSAVPWRERTWHPDTKTWSCAIEYMEAFKALADTFGPVEVEEK